MLDPEQLECVFRDVRISHGSEVCLVEKCMICNYGVWEDNIDYFPPSSSDEPL
jgi:hypothetical protein